jgi:predicted dinucleotide-binding enzyme
VTDEQGLTIGIVGGGNIGATLGHAWLSAGHAIRFGLREGSSRGGLPDGASRATPDEAVAGADVVLFAVPGGAMEALVGQLRPSLGSAILVDATNDVRGPVLHSRALDALRAGGMPVYRAFSTLGWENLADPRHGDDVADLLYAGPDGGTRVVMERLVRDVGLRPIWLGDGAADAVDGATRIWFALAMGRAMGRGVALKVITR